MIDNIGYKVIQGNSILKSGDFVKKEHGRIYRLSYMDDISEIKEKDIEGADLEPDYESLSREAEKLESRLHAIYELMAKNN